MTGSERNFSVWSYWRLRLAATASTKTEDDELFPAAVARTEFAKVRRVYEHLDASARAALDVFPGDHAWNGRVAVDFLTRAL